MIIDSKYFLDRIGEASEQPNDRRFWSAMALWQWRADWRKAEEDEDWPTLDSLDRQYELIVSL